MWKQNISDQPILFHLLFWCRKSSPLCCRHERHISPHHRCCVCCTVMAPLIVIGTVFASPTMAHCTNVTGIAAMTHSTDVCLSICASSPLSNALCYAAYKACIFQNSLHVFSLFKVFQQHWQNFLKWSGHT